MTDIIDDFVDFSLEREEGGLDWRELTDSSDTAPAKFEDLVNQILLLPESTTQIPVLVAYAFTPSALSNNLPIGVFYGSSGAGKSECIKLISHLRNSQVNTAASTFASIRNSIENARWYDSDKTFEKNFILLWDDINENVFTQNEQMFSLFKSGINRKSTITIADKMGVNMEFKPFSPKLVSTVQPFWDNPKLGELKRRLLPFLFQKVIVSENVGIDLIAVDEINFNGFSTQFDNFWLTKDNRESFNKAKRSLSRLKSSIPIEVYRLYIDVVATSCVIYNMTTKEVITLWEQYFEYISDNVFDANIGLQRIFAEWLEFQESEFLEFLNIKHGGNFSGVDKTIRVKPIDALNYLDGCYSNGEIANKVDRNIVESFFVAKGYVKTKTRQGYYWTKTL